MLSLADAVEIGNLGIPGCPAARSISNMELSTGNFKVYIIGLIAHEISEEDLKQFKSVQQFLEQMAITVFNPLEHYTPESRSDKSFYKNNLSNLARADAIFIMPNVLPRLNECAELKIALDLNKIIIQPGVFFVQEI